MPISTARQDRRDERQFDQRRAAIVGARLAKILHHSTNLTGLAAQDSRAGAGGQVLDRRVPVNSTMRATICSIACSSRYCRRTGTAGSGSRRPPAQRGRIAVDLVRRAAAPRRPPVLVDGDAFVGSGARRGHDRLGAAVDVDPADRRGRSRASLLVRMIVQPLQLMVAWRRSSSSGRVDDEVVARPRLTSPLICNEADRTPFP